MASSTITTADNLPDYVGPGITSAANLPSYTSLLTPTPLPPTPPGDNDIVDTGFGKSGDNRTSKGVLTGLANAPGIAQIGAGLYAGYEKVAPESMGGAPSGTPISTLYDKARDQQQEAYDQSLVDAPIATEGGKIAGSTALGAIGGAGAGAVLDTLPAVTVTTPYVGTAVNAAGTLARNAIVGGAAGAASNLTAPVSSAKNGAEIGSFLGVLGSIIKPAASMAINAYSGYAKNSPIPGEIAQTSDTLLNHADDVLQTGTTPGASSYPNIATTFGGNPNSIVSRVPVFGPLLSKVLGEGNVEGTALNQYHGASISAQNAPDLINQASVNSVTPSNALTAYRNTLNDVKAAYNNIQQAKQAGVDMTSPEGVKLSTQYTDAVNNMRNASTDSNIVNNVNDNQGWQDTLSNEPKLMINNERFSGDEPITQDVFQQNYNKLSTMGKNALIAGRLANSVDSNGGNLTNVSADIGNIIRQAGNKSYSLGENKFTLLGLQKWLANADIPNGAEKTAVAQSKNSFVGSNTLNTVGRGVLTAAADYGADLASNALTKTGIGWPLAKAQIASFLIRKAFNTTSVRNALIDLNEARTPTQVSNAYKAVTNLAIASSNNTNRQ